MSAPKTNLPKQKLRHRGPLLGITLSLIVAVLLVVWFSASSDDTDTGTLGNADPDAVDAGRAPAESPATPDAEAPPE